MVNFLRCRHCLNASTRPRISFDKRGWCNACQWMEEKQTLDWSKREEELLALLEKYRSRNGGFDCLVPVSGGKDGSYVAYKLKNKYGMNFLSVTVTPPLSFEIGNNNLRSYIDRGGNHIQINPDTEAMRILNRLGFIQKGSPYYGWLTAIQSAVVRVALNMQIPLIFYGEEGETEYGGCSVLKYNPIYDVDFMQAVYLEGGYEKILHESGLSESQLYFFRFPSKEEIAGKELKITHWSYFEPWDSYRNYLIAKEHYGLLEADASNSGTFTNFAQNDQALYALHTYLMYLKFGFGRATQDAGVEIRRGAMTREQGVNLVRLYDGQYPEEFVPTYLDYYKMKQEEFDAVLDRWVNRDLFEKKDGRWTPLFTVE